VPAQRVVATGPERFFHARARLARSADFQQHFCSDAQHQRLVAKQRAGGEQVQPRHHEVAAQHLGGHGVQRAERGDHRQVLGLHQRDLSLAARLRRLAAAVALQAAAFEHHRLLDGLHGRSARGPQKNGVEAAGAGKLAGQFAEVGHAAIVRKPRRMAPRRPRSGEKV
jgi:hypothetical protein